MRLDALLHALSMLWAGFAVGFRMAGGRVAKTRF
jgi:hypothetical protein